MPAVNLALDDVNHNENLLPGFILKLHSNDSQVYEMFNIILKEKHCRNHSRKISLNSCIIISV